MITFEKLYSMGHEEVIFFSDPSVNLKAIVAIHNTTLGPALGGTRIWNYATEAEAIEDALRLSRGMTYKNSISGLNLGGGKAVIIADPKTHKSEAFFRSYGKFIHSLNGRYITAEDVNTSVEDIMHIFKETPYVAGVAKEDGGSGNPSPWTALGVYRGMQASAQYKWGNKSLKGKRIILQGAGSVGTFLAKHLSDEGAIIYFTDINEANVKRFKETVPNATYVDPNDVYDVDADIYAPCALGATINDDTIKRLKVQIVCGAANNQLKENRHGDMLRELGILYAPDYLVNGGGVINVSLEFDGWSEEKALAKVNTIFDATLNVFRVADEQNIPVYKATDFLAEKRIADIKKISGKYLGQLNHRIPGSKKR